MTRAGHELAKGRRQLLRVMQLSSVSKAMAAAVANTLDSQPSLLLLGWDASCPLDTRLLLSWAGRFSALQITRTGIQTPGLERFLAAACSLSKLRLKEICWNDRFSPLLIDQGRLTRLLGNLPCLRELTFVLDRTTVIDKEVWLPSQQLASKLGKISVECWLFDRSWGACIADRCMRFLTAHLQAGGRVEVRLVMHTSDLSIHRQVAAQLAGLPCPGSLWLRLKCSDFPLQLQQCWEALPALQGCHLVLCQRTCNFSPHPPEYDAHHLLQALPRSRELTITVKYSTVGPLRITSSLLRLQSSTVCIRMQDAQELHVEGGSAGFSDLHGSDQPWQLSVQGAGGVRGLSGFQAMAEGLLLQNKAAQAAGWKPAWVQELM